jgi:hypothetical protein
MMDANELTWGSTTIVGGFTLDDNPLWAFIGSDVDVTDDLPTSCLPGNFSNPASFVPADVWAHLSTMTYAQQMVRLLQRCFVHYTGDTWDDDGAFLFPEAPTGCGADLICTAPVFTRNSSSNDSPDLYDIQYTSRFAYIPQLTTGFPSGSSDPVNIARFRAVFLHRLYGGNCGGGGCDIQFDPGVGYSYASSETKASAVTGFLFPDSMLPGGLGGPTAPMDLNVNTFVRLIQ